MRFLLDENAEYRLALFLRAHDHDVTSIARDYTQGMSDRDILDIAYREQRIVITNDRDFGALVFRQRLPHAGVIFFRLGMTDALVKRSWLAYLIEHYPDELHHFIVVTDRGIRVRRG
jgi:predicted nuclease of predicted toxin-antitoxin system